MKKIISVSLLALTLVSSSCAKRHVRQACDITPGNYGCEIMDWTYGAGDIKIQSRNICAHLMDRWYASSDPRVAYGAKPRLTISSVDNRTDMYISTDMIRDIIEGIAVEDGRFEVVVGDCADEQILDATLSDIETNPKYQQSRRPQYGKVKAPEFLAKILITKAVSRTDYYDYEDYRMTVKLFDVETQELIDSASDTLQKKVEA